MKKYAKDILFTAAVLIASFCISIGLQKGIEEHVSTLFAFAVFIISLYTKGYVYGIVSAIIGTLAINYAFTFPYFAFNFTIPVNLISAIIMVTIALLTGALTTKIKQHEAFKAEGEKERMRANLLRAVSHDIRTPLTTIYGSASALIENGDRISKEQQQEMLLGIKEDTVWLVRMVENLLSVTRVDGGRIKISKIPAVIDELADSALQKFKKNYPDVKIDISLPETFLAVPMDAVLIEQVLINLLENAVIHGTGYTKIQLRIYRAGNKAIFEIEDDGCGIDPQKIDLMLNGYYEYNHEIADGKKKNAGIGLSVCASIIKAHNGEITAENTQKGALFRFVLYTEEKFNEQ